MIEELGLWAAQDAIVAAVKAQEAFDAGGAHEVPVDLGFPADVQPEHFWLEGGAEGSLTNELTGTTPSDETDRIKAFLYVQSPGDYVDVRDRLRALARAFEDAMRSDAVAVVVPSWSIPNYALDAGTDGTNRQLVLELTLELRSW